MSARRAGQNGFTLIESMLAMAIMMVGAVGLMGLFTHGVRMNGDARRMTRATAIAQDLLNNVALWPYPGSSTLTWPLTNVSTTNDTDIADVAVQFESDPDPVSSGLADHGEADLTALGALWTGIPSSALGGEFERYWNVSFMDTNSDGINDAIQIAVIVRWQQNGRWRRIVLVSAMLNPQAS